MADAEIVQRLVAVHGIGRWSAEMFLMFFLGRPDVLPVDDYSLRKAYARAFNKRALPSPKALEKLHTHLLFQLPYLVAQGGLRDMKEGGGAREMKFLGHCEEISKVADLHRWIMSQCEARTNKD